MKDMAWSKTVFCW